MAQEEKIIIDLKFDTKDAEKNLVKLQANLDGTKNELKSVERARKKGIITAKEANEQRAKLNVELKQNSTALSQQQKELININNANKSAAGSNDQLKAQLSVLTLEYNKLGKEEREAGDRGKELNNQINSITDSLKGNEEAVGDNRRSVGDYEKANQGLAEGFGDLDEATGGYGAQLKALLANPVVLVITGIVAAFALLKKAFTRTEDGANKFAKAQAILGGIMTAFMDVVGNVADTLVDMFTNPKEALSNFASAIKTNIINRFEGMLELIPQIGKAIGQLFEGNFAEAGKTAANAVGKVALGVEDVVGKVTSAGEALGEFAAAAEVAANKAARLADAEANLAKSQRNLEVLQLTFLKNAEKQRQIRDDESKSIAERTAANEKLGKILEEQSQKELAIANQALAVANMRIALEGKSTENLDERAEALIGIAEIEERITGQQSEQLVNINSLKKEQTEQELADAEAKVNAAIDAAQAELDIIVAANKTKIEEGKFLNDELFAQEQARLELQKQAQLKYEAEKLAAAKEFFGAESEQAVVAQQEYNAAVNLVNEENELANEELKIAKKEADDEQALVDYETQREIEILRGEDKFERQKLDLKRSKDAEIASAESSGADKKKIDEKYALLDKQIDKAKFDNKLQIASQTFGNLAALAGKESAAGKALAIAQTTIDTYKGATAAFSGMVSAIPGPVGIAAGAVAAAVAVASGIANVRKIASTQTPKAAKGGIFGGNLHSNGGNVGVFEDGTRVEVERDEAFVVINRNSTAMMNRLSDINVAGGGVDFSNGETSSFMQDGGVGINGITSSVDQTSNTSTQIIDAVQNQPAPVVVVQDINEVQGQTATVEQRAII